MNVITMPQLTPAEKALVERFGRVAFDLPGNTDVARKRDEAIETLKFSGLPTRRVEAFHYTDLRRLLATVPADKQD
ncbi:MAG TPA: Fe-S cluster assembly protein SufD, partial [Rhizobiaceae bacterium]|nr:Fe-S cluster assembly protein SufD [Rhizobiaceae bacterium]